jgi:DNA-binding SARP family transcriptional activator
LRTTLWRLRRPECTLVATTTTHVGLNPEVRIDVSELDAVANRVLRGGTAGEGELERLRTAGDVLPDSYDDWVIIERERFRQVRLHALEALCEALVDAGEFPAAINAGLAAVDGEPLRESAHRAVIRAHVAEGNYNEAIRQYRLFRGLLADKLGLQPSPEMRRLVESLPRGEPHVLHTG